MGAAALSQTIHARLDALTHEGGVGIAVSGGGDSVALLLVAAEWAVKNARLIEAATVDHGLRPVSGVEAAGVASLCARLGVAHEILSWRDRPDSGNLSATAREARIALLGDWARRRDLATIALGHTLDDQAETVLLRLARGAGVDGLSGMAAQSFRDGAVWIRPLLEIRRAELRQHLLEVGVEWADDPTNDDETYARIRMRKLIAANPDIDAAGLAATARRLQGQRAALEWLTDDLAGRVLRWGGLGEAVVDLVEVMAAPEDTRFRLLSRVMGDVSGASYRPRQTAIEPLVSELKSADTGSRTLHGCIVAWTENVATICREPAAAAEELTASAGVLWDRRWRVDGEIAGARIARLGGDGEAALAALRKNGAWEPPEHWRAAPRAARLASPALWRGETLEAAPLAEYGSARATLIPVSGKWRPSLRDAPFRGRRLAPDVT